MTGSILVICMKIVTMPYFPQNQYYPMLFSGMTDLYLMQAQYFFFQDRVFLLQLSVLALILKTKRASNSTCLSQDQA